MGSLNGEGQQLLGMLQICPEAWTTCRGAIERCRLQSEYLAELMGSTSRPSILLSYLVVKMKLLLILTTTWLNPAHAAHPSGDKEQCGS